MATVLVFPRATKALVRTHTSEDDRIIAVDGGADVCREAGRTPALIVGDMDSVSQRTLTAYEEEGVPIERHPTDKRDTDGMIALSHVDENDLVLVGAGGGRPDHTLANLHLIAAAATRGKRVRAEDEDATMWAVTPARAWTGTLPEGSTISLIPLATPCEGVTLEGLAFPLEQGAMPLGDPFGVSNRAAQPRQRVQITSGVLLVIAPRGEKTS